MEKFKDLDKDKKISFLIENVREHFKFVDIFLTTLDAVLVTEDLSKGFYEFLNSILEEIKSDEDIFDSSKKISNYLCKLAFRPLIDGEFLTEERADEFIEKDPWRLYSKTLYCSIALKDGLITQEEYVYIMNNPNPTLQYIHRLGTLVYLYGKNYIPLKQGLEIKVDKNRDKILEDLSIDEERESGNRFSLEFAVRDGEITQDQLEKVMLIQNYKKRDNIVGLLGLDPKTRVARIMKYLEKKGVNLSRVDLAEKEDKLKVAVIVLFEYIDKVNSETNS